MAGKQYNVEFWKLPFGLLVEAPDDALAALEECARIAAPSGWANEMASDAIHFRFASDHERLCFILCCGYHRVRIS
jgi:hypothetical protein